MGGEVTGGMILFMAAITVAGAAAVSMTSVVGSMANELRQRGDGLAEAIATDISIVNDPDNVPYSSGTLTLYVKNTGSAILTKEELTVIVDGVARTFTATLLDGATSWTAGTVQQLSVTVTLSAGDHRARVTHTPDVHDAIDFQV